ncbi:hypothetical protein Nepgr_018200 [Nepenthes gracilis]|uniref:Vacuolar iron transporter n=1 Tax=Nepenthes gracilis TaxID=150966 RepID=A0AAD3SSZ5_NEPGR|nr:hypothetical protein Nepgr_018200 [Nepenthes gracilis]
MASCPQPEPSDTESPDVEHGFSGLARKPVCTKPNSLDLQVKVSEHSKRAQWLRAAVLGANDGLLSTASLMVGVGAVKKDVRTMILTGTAGLLAGACSMAMGEFVSVYSQYDIELSQLKRENMGNNRTQTELDEKKKDLPNPFHAAAASAVAFAVGAGVPLLAAAFIRSYMVRLGVVVATVSVALLAFGGLAAVLGKVPPVKPSLRLLVGGWIAMGVTFGLIKLAGSTGI